MAPVQTVILAGARASGDPLAISHNLPSKAHIEIAGRSMLGRVLDAIVASDRTGPVKVIGLTGHSALQQAEDWPKFSLVSGKGGPAASVYSALSDRQTRFPVLVTTCDHALLTREILDDFLARSQSTDADLTVALASREVIEAAHPGVARTYLKFGNGAFSSCNLFLLNTPAAMGVVRFWQSAEADRKRPWAITLRFGPVAALRLLIGRPGLERAFSILSARLGVAIAPVIVPFGDAAVDVDKPSDLALVEQILTARR